MNGQNESFDIERDFAALQWQEVRDELSNLANCGTNWDGEGAIPARPGLIEATLRLCQMLQRFDNPAPVDVYLAPDGTVILEWHPSEKCAEIINVRVSDNAEVTVRELGKKPLFLQLPIPPAAGHSRTAPGRPNEPISYLDEGAYELAA